MFVQSFLTFIICLFTVKRVYLKSKVGVRTEKYVIYLFVKTQPTKSRSSSTIVSEIIQTLVFSLSFEDLVLPPSSGIGNFTRALKS